MPLEGSRGLGATFGPFRKKSSLKTRLNGADFCKLLKRMENIFKLLKTLSPRSERPIESAELRVCSVVQFAAHGAQRILNI